MGCYQIAVVWAVAPKKESAAGVDVVDVSWSEGHCLA